jgi:hypothetical protein
MNLNNSGLIAFTALFLWILSERMSYAQISIDLEAGMVTTGYNDVRIPGEAGTFISFSDEFSSDPKFFQRIRSGVRLGQRGEVLALFAPLRFTYTGAVDRDIFFQGETYPAESQLTATYKFNSYRATYRYYVLEREKLDIGLGLTLKARDAIIAIEGGGLKTQKTDFGFVPLINFVVHWQPTERIGLLLDGDALAAPSGRAEDVLAALTFRANENLTLKAGYRILEGGADNRTVYTFSMFHYGVVGVIYRFK